MTMRDVLLSWNDTPTKEAVVEFVQRSATKSSPGFVAPADRVAAFDNDGTLWVEQPIPPQAPFLIEKLVARAQTDPSLAEVEPYRSIIQRDPEFFGGLSRQEPDVVLKFLSGVGAAFEGMTPQAYDAEVREFVARYRDERFGKRCTELVYQPMLELFDLLRAHEWRVYVCSGGGRDFMRVIAEDTWGIFQENVIGSAPEWSYRDGHLVRDNAMRGELALGPGKPSHLFARTGRLPKFAAGNGDVDIEMLEVADFALVIVHDDADREYAVTGGAERVLDVAAEKDWQLVSMKNDWNHIYAEGTSQ
ncbi:MAG: HAD family hydrolase [Acidimicrobiales bacterium]